MRTCTAPGCGRVTPTGLCVAHTVRQTPDPCEQHAAHLASPEVQAYVAEHGGSAENAAAILQNRRTEEYLTRFPGWRNPSARGRVNRDRDQKWE